MASPNATSGISGMPIIKGLTRLNAVDILCRRVGSMGFGTHFDMSQTASTDTGKASFAA